MLGLRFVWGLSLVAASGGHSSSWCGGHSSSRCAGLSLSWPLPLRGTGSRRAGLAVVAHGPSWSAACGIFPDQGSNPCPLHWQADSQPLRHQGSPITVLCCLISSILKTIFKYILPPFLFVSGVRVNLVPVPPSWSEAEVQMLLFLMVIIWFYLMIERMEWIKM